jgi:hypothetical protein
MLGTLTVIVIALLASVVVSAIAQTFGHTSEQAALSGAPRDIAPALATAMGANSFQL